MELSGVGGIFETVEVGLPEGVEAVEEWHLGGIGQAGNVAVVAAGQCARGVVGVRVRGLRMRAVRVRHGWRCFAIAIARICAVPAVTPARGIGSDQMKVLPAFDEDAAPGLYQRLTIGIGKAADLDGAFVHHHARVAGAIDFNAEFRPPHGNGSGRGVHPVRIRAAGKVVDLHPHNAQHDIEKLA